MILSVLSSLALVSGLMVARAKNPVHSVLFPIPVFHDTSGLILLLGLNFSAIICPLIHIGAIVISFLFIVMMFHIQIAEIHEEVLRYLPPGQETPGRGGHKRCPTGRGAIRRRLGDINSVEGAPTLGDLRPTTGSFSPQCNKGFMLKGLGRLKEGGYSQGNPGNLSRIWEFTYIQQGLEGKELACFVKSQHYLKCQKQGGLKEDRIHGMKMSRRKTSEGIDEAVQIDTISNQLIEESTKMKVSQQWPPRKTIPILATIWEQKRFYSDYYTYSTRIRPLNTMLDHHHPIREQIIIRKLGKADSITFFVPTADSSPSAAYSFATEDGKTFRLNLLCSTTAIAAGSGTNLISFS
ncbi:hypothetical protein Ddye_021734 [Dipteronia dyeriana]|uniref:NADH:ubiquinone reductase (H(+)-translocating) n=1 Tax=Dipteronia dyeriana TaxID=168575 RepID=A0AAD9U280_9ROSI|nr:hypothetical protein Ddye_021734 [Dipteronia dyeriana]